MIDFFIALINLMNLSVSAVEKSIVSPSIAKADIVLLLEEDGTCVEDDEILMELNGSTLLAMGPGEVWTPAASASSCSISMPQPSISVSLTTAADSPPAPPAPESDCSGEKILKELPSAEANLDGPPSSIGEFCTPFMGYCKQQVQNQYNTHMSSTSTHLVHFAEQYLVGQAVWLSERLRV